MGRSNVFARHQLISVAKRIDAKIESFRQATDDMDEWDLELRLGIRDGLLIAQEEIYNQVEKLQNEQK